MDWDEIARHSRLQYFKRNVEIYDKWNLFEKISISLNFDITDYDESEHVDRLILELIHQYLIAKHNVNNLDMAAKIHHQLYCRLNMIGSYIYFTTMKRTYFVGDKTFPVNPDILYYNLLDDVQHIPLNTEDALLVGDIKQYAHGDYLIQRNKQMIIVNYTGDKAVFGESKHALLLMATGEWTLGII